VGVEPLASTKKLSVLRGIFHDLRYLVYFPVFISLIYGLLRLIGPLFMIVIFDRVLPSRSVPTLVSLLILLVIVYAFMALLDYSRRRILARFGAQFQERVEDKIFGATDRGTYLDKAKGRPAAGIYEADQLRSFFHSGSLVAILDFFWSPLFLVAVFIISPFVGWIVLAGIAVLVLVRAIKDSLDNSRDERQTQASDKVSELKDTLARSPHVIESHQMTAAFNKRWVLARRQSRDASVEANDWNGWFSTLSRHVSRFLPYSVLAAGAYLTISGEMTIGSMVACMRLARLVHGPTERFMKEVTDIGEVKTNWKILDKILSAHQAPTASVSGKVSVRMVQVRVRCPVTKNLLLNNVNLKIPAGSSVSIVGGAGSGKTVLADILIGRFPRASGKIFLGDIDLERLSIDEAASTFGYVPQRVDLFLGSIEENITGLDIDPNEQRLLKATHFAGIHKRIASLPEGYATRVDAIGSIFSKSERHQLGLARAFYPDPKVLILDEPDATFRNGLGSELKPQILRFLKGGGILILLTRLPLKNFDTSKYYTITNGILTEKKIARLAADNVVSLQDMDAR